MRFLLLILLVLSIPEAHAEMVNLGDIDVKYKIEGSGNPILLLNGFGNPLDSWPTEFIEKLKENHTVITFDYRGVGNTTLGDKKYTLKQLAIDADLFLDKINITKTDVLGTSMGGMVVQEMALFSKKIDKLVVASSHCGQDITQPSKEIQNLQNLKGSELKAKLRQAIYPKGFNFSTLPKSSEVISDSTISKQQEAILDWKGTCDKLKNIRLETLVIVGKNDNFVPPQNSVTIAKNIKGSWLIQLEDGWHPLAATSSKFADSILFFLS